MGMVEQLRTCQMIQMYLAAHWSHTNSYNVSLIILVSHLHSLWLSPTCDATLISDRDFPEDYYTKSSLHSQKYLLSFCPFFWDFERKCCAWFAFFYVVKHTRGVELIFTFSSLSLSLHKRNTGQGRNSSLAGIWRQELKRRWWSYAVYCCVVLISYTSAWFHPGRSLSGHNPTVGWTTLP